MSPQLLAAILHAVDTLTYVDEILPAGVVLRDKDGDALKLDLVSLVCWAAADELKEALEHEHPTPPAPVQSDS